MSTKNKKQKTTTSGTEPENDKSLTKDAEETVTPTTSTAGEQGKKIWGNTYERISDLIAEWKFDEGTPALTFLGSSPATMPSQ